MNESPILFTMSSVREESTKRGVPLDFAKFLLEAWKMVAEDEEAERVHLIGDVCCLGVEIAKTSQNPLEAIQKLRRALLDNQTTEDYIKDYENRIAPLTLERVSVAQSICEILGSKRTTVMSGIEYLRQHPEIARSVLNNLAAAYQCWDKEEKDINLKKILKEINPEKADESRDTSVISGSYNFVDIARATLPARLRNGNVLEETQQSIYGAIESLMAAAFIEEGGIYASYKGSDKALGGTIIENMRTFVQMFVYKTFSDTELVRKIGDQFIIEDLLDGVGFREGGGPITRCDPHTLDQPSKNNHGAKVLLQKLPLMLLDDKRDRLRVVTPDEFRTALVDPATAGISGPKTHLWLKNLSPVVAYLEQTVLEEKIPRIMTSTHVSEKALLDWVGKANKRLERLRKGEEPTKLDPIVPGSSVDFVIEVVHAMATDICNLYQRRL